MTRLLVDPFRSPFMQRALVEVLLLGVLAGVTGVYVVLRRLAFIGDALTHTVFPGIVIAFLLEQSIVLGALAAGLLSAVLLSGLSSRPRVTDDSALAILLTSFFALGVVLVSRARSYTTDLTVFLFGRVLTVDRTEIVETAALAVLVLVGLGLLHKELVLRAFDPGAAEAMGYRLAALDLALNLAVALVVVAAVKAVGTVLVIALVVTPAAGARLVSGRIGTMMGVSCLIGAAGGWLGLVVSYEASLHHGVRLASGATIVVVLSVVFVALLGITGLRKRATA